MARLSQVWALGGRGTEGGTISGPPEPIAAFAFDAAVRHEGAIEASMEGINASVQVRHTVSADGTPITYYVAGDGPRSWLIPPAMGAPLLSIKHLIERFSGELRVVSWDMRGFHRSGAPSDRDAYDVDRHLEDLVAVRDHAGLDRFILGGWSMGVQLSLSYHHRHPDDVRALVLINGPFEHMLDAAMPATLQRAGLGWAVHASLAVARRVAPLLSPGFTRLLSLPGISTTLEQAGLLARRSEHFEQVFEQFRGVDWQRYLTVMGKLHEHSAAAYLAEVAVPTLVTAGGRDCMTPVATAEQLQREVPGAELFIIDEATHYLPVEFGPELAERIARFFAERLEPAVSAAAEA